MTGNPLLLSTLLMVHHLDGKLPNGRANLYKRYVDGMLGIWDDRHNLIATDIQLSSSEKRKIVRGIALYLFLSEKETIDEHILVEWLENYLPKIDINASAVDVLLILRERSGLIIGPGIYSFAHKTIAEFLVAEAIIQGDQNDILGKRIDRFRLFEHRNDDRWNTVLFLWIGLAPFSDLESFVYESIKESNWALALGIIFDQYDRFNFDIRRKIFLKLITSYPTSLFEQGEISSFWVPNFTLISSGFDLSVPRQISGIRSLHGNLELDREINRSIDDNTISWNDCSKANGKLYNLFWFKFASRPRNLEEWQFVLKSRFPKGAPKLNYLLIIASWNIQPRIENKIELESFVETLIRIFPITRSFLPIVIISNIIYVIIFDRAKRKLYDESNEWLETIIKNINENEIEFVNHALRILVKLDASKMDAKFLNGSSQWRFLSSNNMDLLETSVSLIKILNNQNKINSDIAQSALEYIRLLQSLRNSAITDAQAE